ncbi:LexA family protein [Brochothrix thermosphacta]|uniref:LexA family protein n=1 Tax=Brochothrix thermosphacta TaxID=2756 RepID=UPI000D78D5CE|nr:XRE family transcriptional regulator [Brochothrix thermosphacta]SPN76640.1 LexA repressor [Brochothrix thermosphacta]
MSNDIAKKIFSKNLNKLIQKHKITVMELSEKLDISYSTVSDWKNGKKMPRGGSLQKLSDFFNVNLSTLLEDNSTDSSEDNQNIKILPLYGDIAAGAIAEIEGVDVWNVETIDIPSVMLGRYANDDHLFSMYVNGDSMNQVIPNGSIIVAKPLEDYMYKDGDIVIFNHDAEYSLKTYRPNMIDGFVVFEPNSDNAGFKNIAIDHTTLHDANMVSISGKVIFFSTIL